MSEEDITVTLTRIYRETAKAWNDGMRRVLHEGGTSSSKTWSIMQFLAMLAQTTKAPLLISVVSESLPHLKRGAVRDFFNIIGESETNNLYFNRTENMYSRPDWKGRIEFFGADDAGKVRGPRRDILFINEGNNVPWETARGLDIRTAKFTIVDWNPVSEFWAHEHWKNRDGNAYCHSTYLDAKLANVIPQQLVDDIESYRDTDPNWWNVYGLGLIGKIEGLVHPYFKIVDKLPAGDYFYGLDFGFSNDPAALTKNIIIGENLYSQELLFEKGLTNDALSRKMDLAKVRKNWDEIFADSAEPKSIQELVDMGWNVKPCEKGQGSVEYGIQKVNQYKQHWTKDSVNGIKSQRNYRYVEDKDGRFTQKPAHAFSDIMDSRRYAVSTYLGLVFVSSPAVNY
uniref:Putative terminase n=1 Tax=viral metagenome TaxID=1070528 RepID=A0A6M3J2T7_9ZZZZ